MDDKDWYELNDLLDRQWQKQQAENIKNQEIVLVLIERFRKMDEILTKLYDKIDKIK